jgi:integrase
LLLARWSILSLATIYFNQIKEFIFAIPDRRFIANESKAKSVTRSELDKIRDEHVRMSMELQQAFGLRREEAIKFQPSFADWGDHLVIKGSLTKGGKERIIPVRTVVQRDVLNRARRLAGLGSLIPSNRNYCSRCESTRATS